MSTQEKLGLMNMGTGTHITGLTLTSDINVCQMFRKPGL